MVKVLKEAFHAAFMLVILPFVIILASSLLNGMYAVNNGNPRT